jgi:hypothetical protein
VVEKVENQMRLFNGERRLSLKRETSDSCETRKTQVELSELEEINQYVSQNKTEQGVQLRYDLQEGLLPFPQACTQAKTQLEKLELATLCSPFQECKESIKFLYPS